MVILCPYIQPLKRAGSADIKDKVLVLVVSAIGHYREK